MNENKGTRKLIDARMVILLSSQLLVGLLLILAIWGLPARNISSGHISGRGDFYREVGNKLQTAGVVGEAIVAYERYLSDNKLDKETESKISFSLGNLYEENGEYEKALHKYYAVQAIDESSLDSQDSSKRIVALLERLKKYNAAKFELKNQTALEKDKVEVNQGGEIVAKIEGRPIFNFEVNEALDQLPEAYKKEFSGKDGKQNFLRKYVADELLVAKARKLQYQNDGKIRRQLENIEKQLLVQRVLEDEIGKKISADPADIKNYYEANKTKFNKPFAEITKQVEEEYKMQKGQMLYSNLMEDILKTEDVKIFADKMQ
ncbi:MAG: hypothetical protein A2504_01625 [Bdellovibrionales bacterium RIFOXYD12_FULL_39_22]|nr:MAG: hypothetical protein A2385_04150 [Bdellovibrionales bacterium RIFOXYB1_FULL_39_21]OFZ42394.1 MAG: hypothetical protein A2485_15345 [Bdellovibrionales bacterium RIFOXYC12_FULL_39_17]OFZ46305.1 MAG: hypothetical protein A2404_13670 [Bdellovibrionales bacterium RIFOXYC1_FULL_39_130]OFZ71543.1 MAG: hypothetical protein A2451_03345 [Bdellovibrionales bacterium RIFOXYC2_FULL_39_8]OFZ75198.1 MAG: hypothetical protein A2560_15725 [Bdellovibrionales bacterium RIFOXYD1_FULL_39_84]OFZ93192.1 MAG: